MKLLVIAAPSGAGKTTIVQSLIKEFPRLRFSVSATTRPPRKNEKNGSDYFFLEKRTFKRKLSSIIFWNGKKFMTEHSMEH